MRGLSFIIGLIGVVAMLTLGASAAWAGAASMPCHDTGADHGGMVMSGDAPSPSPAPSPAKAQMVMACCVACVSPSLPAVPVAVSDAHPRPLEPARLDLPRGRSPSPETGPPRLRL